MNAAVYTGLEFRRSIRNRRFFIFSFTVPVLFYLVFALSSGHDQDFGGSGISGAVFYLAGLASFSTMSAMIGGGGRIAAERQSGWNRQLRLTPLTPRVYFTSKLAVSYFVVLVTIVMLSVLALLFGADLGLLDWLEMVGLILLGAVPFAGLGIAIGHLLTPDSMGPVLGVSIGLLAFIGGTWFPLTGTLKTVGELLPSYWIAAAGHTAAGGAAWSAEGWIVVAVWSVAMTAFARWAWRRDTARP